MLWGVLAGGLLLAGCQLPFGQKSRGFQLTLNFSSPSLRGIETSSRVLLPTATKVTLTAASEGKTLDTQTVSTAGQSAVTFTLNLPPLATYDLKAEARNAGGTLVFAGSTSVKLVGNVSGTLNLFPVDAAGSMTGWTAVTATPANQPAGASVAQSLSLNTGESQSFLLDWGNGSAFTFETAAGLEIYLQTTTGSPVTIPSANRTVQKSAAPGNAWITYYAPSAPASLSALGWFTIPLQSVTSDGTLTLSVGGSKQLGITVAPLNADHQALSDFTWVSSAPTVATVDTSGKVTAVSGGSTSITLTSNHVSTVTDTVLVTVTGNVSFAPLGYSSLAFASAATITEGDSLLLTTTDSSLESGGTDWMTYVDNALVPSSWSGGVMTIATTTLPAGTHFLDLFVTWNGVTYNGSLTFTVLSKGAL